MGVGDASLNMKIIYTQQIELYELSRREQRDRLIEWGGS